MSEFTERLRKDDDLSARIEAADIIDEMEWALREVTAWKMAIDLVAPSLGGATASMHRAESVLAKLECLK